MNPNTNCKINIDSKKIDATKKRLCVVMPAYNEGAAIKKNLLTTSSILGEFIDSYSIIVVNDGSSDNTIDEIKSAALEDAHISYISYKPNHGKGFCITTGIKYSNSDYVAFLDSDLELSPAMLKDFLTELKLKKADIAIGSKLHKDSKLNYPVTRKFLSFGYYIILKILFNLNLKDTQTGIKLFKSEVIKPICNSLQTSGFAFDIEILAKAAAKGYKIIEMPIELNFCRDRREKSRFSFKLILGIFADTIRIKKEISRQKRYIEREKSK